MTNENNQEAPGSYVAGADKLYGGICTLSQDELAAAMRDARDRAGRATPRLTTAQQEVHNDLQVRVAQSLARCSVVPYHPQEAGSENHLG